MSAHPEPQLFVLKDAQSLEHLQEAFSRITQRELESTLPPTVRDVYYVEQLHAYFRKDPLTYITSRPIDQREALYQLVISHLLDIDTEHPNERRSNEER